MQRRWAVVLAIAWLLGGLVNPAPAHAGSTRLCPIVLGGEGAEKHVMAVNGALEGELGIGRYDLVGPYATGKNAEAAEKAIRQARSEVERGRRKFAALELEEAAEHFERAVETFRTYAANVRDVDRVAAALSLLAATALLQGNDGVGTTHLSDAIALRPDLEPDATAYNEDMRKVFTQTRDALRKSRGTLSIEVTPPAAVFVDGIYRGVSPVTVSDLVEGQHLVRAAAQRTVPSGTSVALTAGGTAKVSLKLEAAAAAGDLEAKVAGLDAAAPDAAVLRALGTELQADSLLVVRVTASGDAKANVEATLYGLATGVKLASVSKPVTVDSPAKTLGDVRGLLGGLKPPSIGIAINPIVGLSDPVKESLEESVVSQLEKAGAKVKALTEEIKPKCLAAEDCRQKSTAGLEAAGLVDLSGKEAGQKLKLKQLFYATGSGKELLKKNKVVSLDELGEGLWLDADVLVDLGWEAQAAGGGAATATATATAAVSPKGSSQGNEGSPEKTSGAAAAAADDSGGAGTAGWILAGLGLAVGATGGALLGWQLPVRESPTAESAAKENAQTIGLAGFSMAIAGGATMVIGLIVGLVGS